jgi:hypothetical protein
MSRLEGSVCNWGWTCIRTDTVSYLDNFNGRRIIGLSWSLRM